MEVRKMWRRKRMEEIKDRLYSILYVIGEYEYYEYKDEDDEDEDDETSYKAAKLALDDLIGQFERSEIIEMLREFLLDTNKNEEVRCGAARVLGTLRANEAIGNLETFLDSDTSLRNAASDAIIQILGKPKKKGGENIG